MMRSLTISLLTALAMLTASAQVETRTAEIEAQRDKKITQIVPDDPSPIEARLRDLKDKKILERIAAGVGGFRARIGGLVTGGGFAVGPEYYRQDLAQGNLSFRTAAQFSFRGFQKYDIQLTAPAFANRKLFADLIAQRHNYASVQYYGPGPDSEKSGRSNYRYEDFSADGMFGVAPWRNLRMGVSAGYLKVNVGAGTDDRFAQAADLYGPRVVAGLPIPGGPVLRIPGVPGFDRQTDFLRYGGFLNLIYTDHPQGPRQGGSYLLQYDRFEDQTLNLHSHNRFTVDLQQYVPFFNKKRVFAFRGKTVLTSRPRGQAVPFYLQPSLGGSDDLRGYRPFRFHDNNMLLLNAEYRYEVFSGMDMAVFADAGKVAPRRGLINFKDLESSVGIGMRFNARQAVFLRVDVAFSHEGFQVWFKFNNVFFPKRLFTSTPPALETPEGAFQRGILQ